MHSNRYLTAASLITIVLTTLHVTDDIVRGFEKGGGPFVAFFPILVVWLYGTLMLSGRRSGYIIMLIASLLGMLAPILHFKGTRIWGEIATSPGGFFFIWTLIAIGVTSGFAVVLAARGLWHLRAESSHGLAD